LKQLEILVVETEQRQKGLLLDCAKSACQSAG